MKEHFLRSCVLLLLVVVTSCAVVPVRGVHMSRRGDVDGGDYTVEVDTFGPGEIPTVVVTGCGERNVTVELIDLATRITVATRRDYVPRDWVRWWYFPDLEPGSYHVLLRINENIVGAVSFIVKE